MCTSQDQERLSAMVKLDRIYTRGGDGGETSLGNGNRTHKDSPRIAALGAVEEANARIGMARVDSSPYDSILKHVQNDLFDIGADLCVPHVPDDRSRLRMPACRTEWLEQQTDHFNQQLVPLHSFILPGGQAQAALLHFSRTGIRQAELACVALSRAEPVTPELLRYLNRLSDLLFVLARHANDMGERDVLWQPGGNDPDDKSR